MAKVDTIIQMIRNAQAAAIAKNGGITANNGAAFEADTKAILQKQIAQQKSAKNDSAATSGQAAMPAKPEVKDTRTTQQQHDDAKKVYDDYTASDEHKRRLANANKTALEQAMQRVFSVPGVSASDAPIGSLSPIPTDSKERELNAMVEHYKQQMEAEENQRVTDENLKELESWSEEDRGNLETYIAQRDQYASGAMAGQTQFDTYNLNPLIEKYGDKKVRQMAESLQWSRNAELMKKTEEAGQKRGNEHAVLGSGESVLTNLAGAYTGPLGFVKEMSQRTGQYSTFDPNNVGNLPAAFGGAVRGQVTETIRGDGDNWLRNLGALAYQGGMSFLDSTARMVASGGSSGISSALAASGSFSNSIRQYSQQGASPEQAAAIAVVNAGLEYATEKLPTEKVLNLFKGGTKKDVIAKVLTQAFLVEPTSEEVNLFAGVAAEAAILGEKSSMNQKIGEMVANGMSYQDAQKQYFTELWKEAAQTYAVSAISGGLSAGGAAILGSAINGSQDTEVANEAVPEAPVVDETADFVAETAAQQAQMVPPEVVEPMPEGLRHVYNAAAIANGLQPEQISPQERGARYKASKVNSAILDLVDKVKRGIAKSNDRVDLGTISDANSEKIQRETGIDTRGFHVAIEARQIDHILKRHGVNGEANQSMADPNDIARIEYALNNPDSVTKSKKTKAYVSNVDGKMKPADTVLYEARLEDGSYYVVQAVPDTKKRTLYVLTAYIGESSKTEAPQTSAQATPGATPEADSAITSREAMRSTDTWQDGENPEMDAVGTSDYIVPDNREEVNRNSGNSELLNSSPMVDTQNPSAEGGQIKGTGAAEENFSGKPAYNATLSADNAQADRRDDVRPMELPRQDINGGDVSAVTGNVYGSRITPDDFASLMEEPTAKGDFSYAKITNDQATQRATETIASAGTWENAYDSWKQSVTSGNAGAEMSARGALFLNHAAQQGNKQLWLETLHYMQKLGTNTAQGLQAFRIIRTLKPADKIEFVKMSVDKMAAGIKEKHGIDLEIDQALFDKLEQANTDEARDAAISDIQQNVADQIPSTFLDKWTALRYMNMLGNLKTNVRNIAGNIGSAAVYRVKDTIATGMESIVHAVSGGKTDRTKSLFVNKDLLDACKEDFQKIKDTVNSGGKYGERMSASSQFEQGVQDKRRIFKNPLLEGYRKGTNWMMNNGIFGDEAFGRAAYSRALAGYLQANGVTGTDLSKVDTALLDKARTHAIKEAQEATFHDNSALAKIVSKVQKDTGFVGQAIMPFTKTPANVLTRAEEFSPLGLINSTVKSIQKAGGNENITGADVINSWAKSITGVGLFALGAAMMDQGLLTGGPDEDEEKAAFDNLNGYQNYAIQLPDGTNYTIDWLTPAAMPMFMGAQFWKMLSRDRDLTFADMEQVFTSIADPMIQMSMLQGLNDSLDGIKNSDNNLGQFFINAAISYLTQGLTNTLMGQIERSTEENRQTTYIDKNSNVPQWLQRQLGKASQKIPGWDYQQMDYRNAWGQTEKNEGGLLYNLLSPGYVSKEQSNRITQELYRLRETTGENVFPQPVEKTVTYTDTFGTKHVNHVLTQTELDTMQRVEGQTALWMINKIMMNKDYSTLTDDQRAEVISNVYKYAQEQGKKKALNRYFSDADAWIQNLGDDAAKSLIQRAALSTINSSVTNIVGSIENGWSVTPAAMKELNALYDSYESMSEDAKKQILDEAISDTAKYLEIRSKGISTAQYLDVVGDIKALEVEPDYASIRDIQTWEAIAGNDRLSASEKDYVMKAYMPDYDPAAKSPQTTELKYDYIRKQLGLSPEQYTQTYRLELDGGFKKKEYINELVDMGYSREVAEKLYDIYNGTEKGKAMYMTMAK